MIRRYVRDHEAPPRFYGCAYYLVDKCVSVAYPVPFHKIIGWGRYLWMLLKRPPRTFRLAVLHERLVTTEETVTELRKTVCVYQEREHWRQIAPK